VGSEISFELREALARVPERQRRALVLREVQGLPASEVAATLGLEPGETYALLSRARRSFARAYEVVTGRPALGVHVAPLLLKLNAALAGSAATAVAATTLAGGLVVGAGGASERAPVSAERAKPPLPAQTSTTAPTTGARAPLPGAARPRVTDGVKSGVADPRRQSETPRRASRSLPTQAAAPGAPEVVPVVPVGTPDRAKAESPVPRNDAPTPAPAPSPRLPVPKPGVPVPVEVPGVVPELPVEPPPLPVDAGELVDSLVPPVPDEPLPPVPSVPAPKLP
jgi:DNA segregation ATPase FtsK/SpoIIIE, S-DNA-T family